MAANGCWLAQSGLSGHDPLAVVQEGDICTMTADTNTRLRPLNNGGFRAKRQTGLQDDYKRCY